MTNGLKIVLIIAVVIVIFLLILFLLGRKRLLKEEKKDKKIIELIEQEKYVIAKCLILSDVVYQDRVAITKEQKKHLKYLDSIVDICNKKIEQDNINQTVELGNYIIDIIPQVEHTQFYNILKYCKPDVNYQNDKGNTVLMAAVENDRDMIIRYLLDDNVNLNAKNNEGKTALTIACQKGNLDIIKKLLENGADATHRDSSGKNIIKYVNTNSDYYAEIINLLIEYGADKTK